MKTTARKTIVLAASLVAAACSSASVGPNPTASGPGSPPAREASSDPRVEAFLDSLYDRTAVRHSFTISRGDTIDCVDFASETGVRALVAQGWSVDELLSAMQKDEAAHAAGAAAGAATRGDTFLDGQPDQAGNVRACSERTVPHVHLTPERIAAAGGLDAYRAALRHAPLGRVRPDVNPTPGGLLSPWDGSYYAHVFSMQGPVDEATGPTAPITVEGGASTMLIGPEIPAGGSFDTYHQDHTLAQVWLTGGQPDSTDLQTLEVGWEIQAGETGPALFVGATADAYANFCLNGAASSGTTCVTWVPFPGTALFAGAPLPASVIGGVQHELSVEAGQYCSGVARRGLPNCVWDVFATLDGGATSLIGYFADSAYGTGILSTGTATSFWTGGEVYDGSGSFTDVQMGEGALSAGATYGNAAYVHDFGYYANICREGELCARALVETGASIFTTQTEFNYNTTAAAGSPSWTNWFYYGDTTPLACIAQGAVCGSVPNGAGGTVGCGSCLRNFECLFGGCFYR